MSDEPISPDPELSAIEQSLGSLAPARSRIDRDLVMFRAGQASARPPAPGRRWMAAAASFALIALGEAALLANRPPPRIVEKIVVVREPAPTVAPPSSAVGVVQAPASTPSGPIRMVLALEETPSERLAEQILRYGLDGLPPVPASAAAWASSEPLPLRSSRLREDEIREALDTGDPS